MRRQTRDEYRLWPEAVGALVVALVLVVSAFVAAGAMNRPRDTGPATGSDPVVFLDVAGPITDADVATCLARGFAQRRDHVQVLYGVHQKTSDGVKPVLVLRNGNGDMRVCDGRDQTPVSRLPVPTATPAVPAKPFTGAGLRSYGCNRQGKGPAPLVRMSLWLSVTDPVATGQLRFVVDGKPAPWSTSTAQGGYLHLSVWLRDVPRREDIRLQTRVLDAAGTVVPKAAIKSSVRYNACGPDIL